MNIGMQIMNFRKEKGWSQAELANKAGISQVMVGKYERGDAIPSFDVAKKIADAFEISLDTLSGSMSQELLDKEIVQKVKEIQNLDNNTQSVLFRIIDTFLRDAKAQQAYS